MELCFDGQILISLESFPQISCFESSLEQCHQLFIFGFHVSTFSQLLSETCYIHVVMFQWPNFYKFHNSYNKYHVLSKVYINFVHAWHPCFNFPNPKT